MNYERVAARLQQNMSNKLAQVVSQYEGDIAIMQEQYEEKLAELQAQLEGQQGEVVPADTTGS